MLSIKTDRGALLAGLAAALKVVERRQVVPIYGHFLLRVRDQALTIVARDDDIQVSARVEGEFAGIGEATLPAHTLHDVVRKFPAGGQVSIDVDPVKFTGLVRCGRSRFNLSGLDPATFPAFTGDAPPLTITTSGNLLAEAIAATAFAISTEETRYYLNGIHMIPADAGGVPVLRLTSTDGHRLARADVGPIDGLAFDMPGVIVPRKACGMVEKLAEAAGDAEIRLGVTSHTFTIVTDHVEISTKVIDGQFPDCDRVIPYGNGLVMTADTAPLAAAVDRAGTIVDDKGKPIKLAIGDRLLSLSTKGTDGSDGSEDLDVDYDGAPLSIAFNSAKLAEMIGKAGGETVSIAFAEVFGSPVLFRNPANPARLFVLMPMRA